MNRHTLSIVSIIVLLALFTISWFNSSSEQIMPDIQFTDIDGKQLSLAQYQGHPLLVVFWATDCPGCIKEIPELIALNKKFGPQGFNILAIAMAYDKLSHIQSMRIQRQLPYPIIWDANSNLAQAFNNVRVTPTHFLISPEGKIVMRKIGELNMEKLQITLYNMGLKKT